MTTSTPEQRQKVCAYCSTPADPLDTKCANCGSALPVAMPLAVARLMEAQGKLQLRKAGFIVIGISAVVGALLNILSGFFALLMIVWIVFIAPAMLMITAWSNAYRQNGSMLGNSAIAVGVWILSLIVMSISGGIVASILS